MDPDRIHAYLQAACAGLGFDVGEVWFSSIQSTVLPTLEQRITSYNQSSRQIKFLQLYTSKTFNSRRNDLLKPETDSTTHDPSRAENKEAESIKKHVLSPMLVNAIANNAQVVWANCPKQEGLLGRSDMRLQTAVGMPVAMDASGNMCIVVMFSPKNVQSNKDAMEYIKLISQGAASSSGIPCLLPVVDNAQKKLEYNAKRFNDWQQNENINIETNWTLDSAFSDEISGHEVGNGQVVQIVNNSHGEDSADFSLLQKDQYGIPILPEFAELNTGTDQRSSGASSPSSEDLGEANEFDAATYGLWSTIMNSTKIAEPVGPSSVDRNGNGNINVSSVPFLQQQMFSNHEFMQPERKNRLEEFASAFLGLSVFDLADVWVPVNDANNGSTTLHNIFAVSSHSSRLSNGVSYFKNLSRNTVVKGWCGAVGRAQCTGNPVWSTNQDIIVDSGRKDAFTAANIKTALAVPIFSQGAVVPSCILCCYSMVRSDSVTFILKFLQQALRSLWAGLDNVEPHESIGRELWKGVAPADLGEMAADTEMQKAFYKKKRPYESMNDSTSGPQFKSEGERPLCRARARSISLDRRARSSSLALQLQSLTNERSQPQHPSENTGQASIPLLPTPPVVEFNTNAKTVPSVNQFAPNPQVNQNYGLDPNPLPSPTMPSLNSNDFREDLAVAKSYIDTINALVQQSGANVNNVVVGQTLETHQNIANNDFAPESTASSAVVICPPVAGLVQNSTPIQNIPILPLGKCAALKVATHYQFLDDHIVLDTVVIVSVNIKADVQSAHRVPRDSVLHMVVEDDVRSQDVIKVPEINSFVQHTVVENGAAKMDVQSLRWVDQICAQATVVGEDVPWRGVKNQLNPLQNSVLSMVVVRNVHIQVVARLREDVHSIVQDMGVEYDANWTVAAV
eukprot:CAMPEP_0203665168 /NCGR_PEP_ID=MMETSP0090-20130426/2422_1 /ASSEMBLY_ACC=CAM_ASM_001088 /TAXON_ID=426623 /ORGANISM="Chaetoceros affinis, Strain CCMP159" /LENGTH=906 /DNA_ID=CAMNT_0050528637 /DNA_START=96 /DNA_END=2817 /DNA_ORIENTATION=-